MSPTFWQVTLEFLSGFGTSVLIFAVTLILALPLGLLVSMCSMTKFTPLKFLTRGFVWIIRGTPLLLQIIAISFIPSKLFKIPTKALCDLLGVTNAQLTLIFVCIAFVINYACYFSEIYRGGIQSISKGQYEAGQVLGMTKTQIFFKVVLLQVIKRVLAPMGNEIITLVKDTSLARVIGVVELFLTAEEISQKYVIFWPLFYAGAFYLLFNGILTLVLGYLEKKLNFFRC